ncbi:MAG: sigma-70 family RNA polymerase sigma factor [Pseudomonadota bacterium]
MALRGKFGGNPMLDDGLEHNPRISRQALAALHQGAFGWALSLTAYDSQAAEDVMQQTYLTLLEGKARFDGASSLKTWLYAVVRNIARRHLRTQKLERRRAAQYGQSPEADAEAPLIETDDGTASIVRAAIRALPARQREVLELVIDAELTVEESAVVLGISTGSARTHYHRAKQKLREQLEQSHGG